MCVHEVSQLADKSFGLSRPVASLSLVGRLVNANSPTPDLEVPPVSIIMALGSIWCLAVVVRREKARDGADDYQMSAAWLEELHLGQKAALHRRPR